MNFFKLLLYLCLCFEWHAPVNLGGDAACAGPWRLPPGYMRIVFSAMRPHFFAFPAGAALSGASTNPDGGLGRTALVATAAGIGWGVGQLLNDVLDRDADAHDAPDRPAVRGLLPARPTITLSILLGLALASAVALLHPAGWFLGLVSMLLIVTYNRFKAFPGLGNLSHGALMSVACLIGAAALQPKESVVEIARGALPQMALCFAWAATYLQANYEKDRRGDRLAGYSTLAHVLGVRRSALFRALFSVAFIGFAWQQSNVQRGEAVVLLGGLLVCLSALWVAKRDSEDSALRAYRWAIHGGALGMLGLGAGAVSVSALLPLLVVSVALTENAFRKSPNP